MTDVEIPHHEEAVITPVPVTGVVSLTGRVPVTQEAADFGQYKTFVLTGTEDKQMILGYDLHRVRAYIQCTGTGPVYVGNEAQCAQVKVGNLAAAGWVLVGGGPLLPVTHKQPVWMVPDGTHSATVSVVVERMQT